MNRKLVLPVAGLAAGACLLVIASVAVGLYLYNSMLGGAHTVQAQSSGTDKGPGWTVTPIISGDQNRQFIVVVAETGMDFVGMSAGKEGMGVRPKVKNMVVYRLSSNGNKNALEFVSSRTIDYDLDIPSISDVSNHDKWKPYDVAKEVKKLADRYK